MKSGLIDLLEPGDSVMADRGFTIRDILDIRGVGLNIPPIKTSDQLSEDELILTRRIATLRIHVERAIGRIKTYTESLMIFQLTWLLSPNRLFLYVPCFQIFPSLYVQNNFSCHKKFMLQRVCNWVAGMTWIQNFRRMEFI